MKTCIDYQSLNKSRKDVLDCIDDSFFITENGIELKWHLNEDDLCTIDSLIEDVKAIDMYDVPGIKINKTDYKVSRVERAAVLLFVGSVLLLASIL